MSSNLTKYWAIAATAIVLVLLGVLIGQRFGRQPVIDSALPMSMAENSETQGGTEGRTSPGETSSTESGSSEDSVPFVIPETFTSLPSEWHTVFIENNFEGYAILFDPLRREVIIEQCRHPGYFDPSIGQPLPEDREFCANVLWGQLLNMDENSAHVRARKGNELDLALELTSDFGRSRLSVSFPDHQMVLVPGSKNDLFQGMDNTPVMTEQKRQKFAFLEAQRQQLKQEQSKANDTDLGDDQS